MNNRMMVALAIAGIVIAGGCEGSTRIAAESANVEIYEPSHVVKDIDWELIAGDYDATMFMVYEVVVDDVRVKLLGVLPNLEEFARSCPGWYYPFTVAVIGVGSRHNSWLFIVLKDGEASCLTVTDRQPPPDSAHIDWWYVLGYKECKFAKVSPDTVFVDTVFWEELKEHGVKLPVRYRPLPDIEWDSQKGEPVPPGKN